MLILLPERKIPLVCDRAKPLPHYWKYPGGKGEGDETPEETAIREVEEEAGILLCRGALRVLVREDRKTHVFILFETEATLRQEGVKARGNEGEDVALFKPEEVLAMPDFFPSHDRLSRHRLNELARPTPTAQP